MIKFVNIAAVLAQMPGFLKEEENERNLISWAMEGYRQNVTPVQWKDDLKVCITKVVNNKAKLPVGITKIRHIGYTSIEPSPLNDSTNKHFLTPKIGDDFVILSEAIAYTSYQYSNVTPLRYVGQNPDLFSNDCVNLFCTSCTINFSVNKLLTQVTLDAEEGWLVIVYSTPAKDTDDNFIIPDDADLIRALALYAEAKHWQDRAGRKEQGAEQSFMSRLRMADNKFSEFLMKGLFRNFNADEYRRKILGQFDSLHINTHKDFINRL